MRCEAAINIYYYWISLRRSELTFIPTHTHRAEISWFPKKLSALKVYLACTDKITSPPEYNSIVPIFSMCFFPSDFSRNAVRSYHYLYSRSSSRSSTQICTSDMHRAHFHLCKYVDLLHSCLYVLRDILYNVGQRISDAIQMLRCATHISSYGRNSTIIVFFFFSLAKVQYPNWVPRGKMPQRILQ